MAEITAIPFDDPAVVDIEELYREHARRVARWASRLGGAGVEPEDVLHEVFLIAKRRLRRFEGDAKITTWLFRTTRMVVRSHRRKQRVRSLLAGLLARQAPTGPQGRPTPVDELERAQTTSEVYRALDRLKDREREVLVLFELEGLSTDAIAALMGARVATVRVWLHRARARFAVVFEEEHARASAPARSGKATP